MARRVKCDNHLRVGAELSRSSDTFREFELGAGRYQVQAVLGKGGMGIVYRARDNTLERPIAIKCLIASEFETPQQDLLRKEAKSLANLSHKNVLQVYDVLFERGCLWIVSELLDGLSFSDFRNRAGPVSTACMTIQVIDALQAVHRKGIIHRDVKPSNLFLTHEGEVKLIDFGVAFLPNESSGKTLVGSLRYADPRMIAGETPDAASDIYGLGLVMFELMHARPVWPQLSPLALYQKVQDEMGVRIKEMSRGLCPILTEHAAEFLNVVKGSKQPSNGAKFEEIKKRAQNELKTFLTQVDIADPQDYLKECLATSGFADDQRKPQLYSLTEKILDGSHSKIKPREKGAWLSFRDSLGQTQEAPQVSEVSRSKRWVFAGTIAAVALVCGVGGFAYYQWSQSSSAPPIDLQLPAQAEVPAPVMTPVDETKSIPPEELPPVQAPPVKKTTKKNHDSAIDKKVANASSTQPVSGEELHIYITSDSWADVAVDGVKVGRVPNPDGFKVAQGAHSVTLVSPFIVATTEKINVAKEGQSFHIKSQKRLVAVRFSLGNPGELLIDNKSYGLIREKNIELPLGMRRVAIKRDDRVQFETNLNVHPEMKKEVELP